MTPNEIVERNMPFAAAIARNIGKSLPRHASLDDVTSSAYVGLIEASRRFRPASGVKFTSFARYRVRGAVLDSLRALDHLTRGQRTAVKQTAALPAWDSGPVPHPDELPSHDGGPEEAGIASERSHALARALTLLPSRQQRILRAYYADGLTMREVGLLIGVNESRVSQIHAHALAALRADPSLRAFAAPREA